MLLKEDAVALFKKNEALLARYMRTIRQGARTSEMYSIFPFLFNALDCLNKNEEQNYNGITTYGAETLAKQILGDSHDPLEIIHNFVIHYSTNMFSTLLCDDVHEQKFMTELNQFYNELSSLCTPKPIILYKGAFNKELAIKFPTRTAHDNFVTMMGATIGTTYSDKPTVLFIPGAIENGRLVVTFPTKALREEAINLLALTGSTITRKENNQLIINDPIILQARQNISIETPEHLYKAEQKHAYMNFHIIAKGFGSYANCSQSFFNGLPAEINKKIASTLADVLGVELDPDTSGRVASTYMGS